MPLFVYVVGDARWLHHPSGRPAVSTANPGCTAKERIIRSEVADDEQPDLCIKHGQSNMWYNSASC